MADNPLGYEKIPKLLKGFAIPSITATLVGSLYNIVNQVFIGQGVGYLGNRRYKCLLSTLHHLPCYFSADWDWKRFPFFSLPREKGSRFSS